MKLSYPPLLMVALLCFASQLHPSFAYGADLPKELRRSKTYRLLTASSEKTRRLAIGNFRRESIHLDAEIVPLVAAARHNIAEAETESNLSTSTSELLYLLGSLHEPEVESVFVDALESKLLAIRILSIDILGQFQFHDSIEFLKRQLSCPEYRAMYGFRFNLLRAFTRMHHPDAVEFLTTVHPSLDGQLRHLIKESLESVTVNDFLGDDQRFAKWQSRNAGSDEQEKDADIDKDKIVFKTAGYESEAIKFEKQQYYGININAQRVMFIIDHSGSMEDVWGGMSRLARAKLELIKVIRELPEDTEFAIMFYETNVRVWRKELLYATEDNKLEAIAFIRRLGFGDRTNTYGALRRSLIFDNDLETVFLLTDGRPTIGITVQPEQILADILGRNRFRHLNFNTIGIAVNPSTEAFLKQLAVGSGGEYRRAL